MAGLLVTRKQVARWLRTTPRFVRYLEAKRKLAPCAFARAKFAEQTLCACLAALYCGSGWRRPERFPRDFMRPVDVAKQLRVSTATVLRWARQRRLPHYRLGQHTVRFRLEDIKETINGKRR